MTLTIMVRGGGDLASGVAFRLVRAGWRVIITELAQPFVVRRKVAFAEAVYTGQVEVEGVLARRVEDQSQVDEILSAGHIAVVVDPLAELRRVFLPDVMVDGRMLKKPPELGLEQASLVIGLGPGFSAGVDCHAVIETSRGHHLGRVIWHGPSQADTGIPEEVQGRGKDRVLRSPASGVLTNKSEIGEIIEEGQLIAMVGQKEMFAPFRGVLRGVLHDGLWVLQGMKVGDLDPRCDPSLCYRISDKSLAVGGGVLETILSRSDLRVKMWTLDAPV
jgi:xanthine dehydrogenase accessory factor